MKIRRCSVEERDKKEGQGYDCKGEVEERWGREGKKEVRGIK